MGTLFRIVLYAESQQVAEEASADAFDRVAELNQVFSDYLVESELSQISQNAFNQEVKVSEDMWYLLSLSDDFNSQSNGSFNAAMGPLTKLWRRAIRRQEMPETIAIEQALANSQWQDVILHRETKTVSLKKEKMRLDMGGIAKGFAIDEAYKTLVRHGISIALVDGGGDIMAGDPPPDKDGWQINVTHLDKVDELYMSNQAIASSGSTYKYLLYEDKVYSHIIDPMTGYGIADPQIINVKASSCVRADGLATTLSLISDVKEIARLKKEYSFDLLR